MKSNTTNVAAEYRKLSDEELVYRFVHRSERVAFDHLFERYGHLILGICMKYFDTNAAKEKTEAFFLQLTDDMKKFPTEGNFKQWIYEHVNNLCIKEVRKEAVNPNLSPETNVLNINGLQVTEHDLQAMETTLQHLEPTERACIEAFYLQNKNYKQIAKEKGLTIAQTRQYIQAGLQTIKSKHEALKHVQP